MTTIANACGSSSSTAEMTAAAAAVAERARRDAMETPLPLDVLLASQQPTTTMTASGNLSADADRGISARTRKKTDAQSTTPAGATTGSSRGVSVRVRFAASLDAWAAYVAKHAKLRKKAQTKKSNANAKTKAPATTSDEPVIAEPAAFERNTPATTIILRCLGYLPRHPCLRVLAMHFGMQAMRETSTTKNDDGGGAAFAAAAAKVAETLRLLESDEGHALADRMEAELRHHWFAASTAATTTAGAATATATAAAATMLMTTAAGTTCEQQQQPLWNRHRAVAVLGAVAADTRRRLDVQIAARRLTGPAPALVILPSQVRVAGYGLFLRGSLPAGSAIAVYGGRYIASGGDAEAESLCSGYRMSAGKDRYVDAVVERSLCAMANDAIYSPFENNATYWRARAVCMKAKRALSNEEIFASYGSAFKLDLVGTMHAVQSSFARKSRGPTHSQEVNRGNAADSDHVSTTPGPIGSDGGGTKGNRGIPSLDVPCPQLGVAYRDSVRSAAVAARQPRRPTSQQQLLLPAARPRQASLPLQVADENGRDEHPNMDVSAPSDDELQLRETNGGGGVEEAHLQGDFEDNEDAEGSDAGPFAKAHRTERSATPPV